jgi:hypothetical protein
MSNSLDPYLEVCILSHGNWDETDRALKSAWRFGLHVHLGVTVDVVCPFSSSLLSVYSSPWTDNFAAVRNSLLDQISSEIPYFLWLDSDEEILCCPSELPLIANGLLLRVSLSTQSGLTSCKRKAMHRNDPDIRWIGAIHERLERVSDAPVPTSIVVPGLAIVHHGYEDREREVAKLSRNAVIADVAIDTGSHYPGATASIARERTALGQATAFDWLESYKKTEALARAQGLALDMCWEAASALAFCGYTRPAEQLAAENPLNLPLQISLLTAHFAREGFPEPDRLEFLLTCLRRILWDDRFPFDSTLINTTRERLVDHIAEKADGLGWGKAETSEDNWKATMTKHTLFIQTKDILLETFEDDTLLLSPETNRVVSLNASGKVFWDALASSASVEDCAAMLAEATDAVVTPEALSHIGSFFQNLLESGMIRET